MSSLYNLTAINGSLSIENNDSLRNLNGLDNITYISRDVQISSNPNLENFDGLKQLTSIGESVEFYNNESLKNIDGLHRLNSIGNDLILGSNKVLENIDGLLSLDSIGWFLIIDDNSFLTELDGLSNLKSIGTALRITNNINLANCCGIQNLLETPDAIGSTITINNNPLSCGSQSQILSTNCIDITYASGTARFDDGLNSCDTTDDGRQISLRIKQPNGHSLQSTFNDGSYSIFLPEDITYAIIPVFQNPYFTASPDTLFITLPEDTLNLVNDFCITPLGDFNDLEITVIPLDAARPGFESNYKILYNNKGTTTLSGRIRLEHNYEQHITYQAATPEVDSFISDRGYQWYFNDLAPFEQEEIIITLRLNSPMDSPPLSSGEELCFTGTVLPFSGDETPDDNTFTLKQTVVNSYDPNEKICLDGNILSPDLVGNFVNYMIRFENTGTASAVNIKVTDTINPRIYDISTIQVTDASHSVEANIQGDVVDFLFGDIELSHVDSINDGYVVFKIKTRDDLLLGDSLTNFADIYFDFNFPIRTNTATTDIKFVTTTNISKEINNLKVYPNPAQNKIYFDLTSHTEQVYKITNAQGELCQEGNITNETSGLDISALNNGLYFITLFNDAGDVYVGRFLSMR